MKIATNQKLIAKNRKIGQILSIAALVVLAVGLWISFQPAYMSYSFIGLLIGFMLSQIGIYYGNRWGRSPRPDELLIAGLKGLDNQYTLYNYLAPAPHLLIGPGGVWVLLPYSQKGTITYSKGRWRQKGGNLYLKVFAQEGLGRPDLDVESAVKDANRFLEAQLGEGKAPPVQPILVFTNPKVEVEAAEAPAPTLELEKLKDYLRKRIKESARVLSPEDLKVISSALPEPEE